MELENKNRSIEEGIQRGSNINNNTGIIRSSKKPQKQKKVPQRGLGVAQLEKIRLEEQQKKIDFKKSPSPPQPNSYNYSSSIIPDISSPNPLLRLQRIDFSYNNSNINIDVPMGWHQVPKIWNSSCEFNLEKENCEVIDPGLAFRLSGECNPIWPLQSMMQRSHYHQSLPSMMNVTSRSSSSSSLVNLQMELPSNQNNSYAIAMWSEEEKMAGMKRSYPFSVDNCKLLPSIIQPFRRSEESTSFGINGSTTHPNPFFRGPSSSESVTETKQKWKKKKKEKENGDFNGDFLTLGPPPPTALTCSFSFPHSRSFDFSSLPYQGIMGDEIDEAGGGTRVGKGVQAHQPFYSFLPPAIIQIGQPTSIITNTYKADDFEQNVIDLNLKL